MRWMSLHSRQKPIVTLRGPRRRWPTSSANSSSASCVSVPPGSWGPGSTSARSTMRCSTGACYRWTCWIRGPTSGSRRSSTSRRRLRRTERISAEITDCPRSSFVTGNPVNGAPVAISCFRAEVVVEEIRHHGHFTGRHGMSNALEQLIHMRNRPQLSGDLLDVAAHEVGNVPEKRACHGVGFPDSQVRVHQVDAQGCLVQQGLELRRAPPQVLFNFLACRDIPRGARNRLHGTVGREDRRENVLVVAADTGRTFIGSLVRQCLPGSDHSLDLLLQSDGERRGIFQVNEVLADRLSQGQAPEVQQRFVGIPEFPVEVEDVDEIADGRQCSVEYTRLPQGVFEHARALRQQFPLMRNVDGDAGQADGDTILPSLNRAPRAHPQLVTCNGEAVLHLEGIRAAERYRVADGV